MAGRKRARAYIGLGANVGDAGATLAAAVHALAALPGARLRGVSRLYATRAGRRPRPAGVPQRGRRPGRAGRTRSGDRGRGAPDRPEERSSARSAGRSASAGDRASSISTSSCSAGIAWRSIGRPRGRSMSAADDPARPRPTARRARTPTARERLFVLAPLADLAPGPRAAGLGRRRVATARRRRERIEGPDAVRPIARWAADRRAPGDPAGGSWRSESD